MKETIRAVAFALLVTLCFYSVSQIDAALMTDTQAYTKAVTLFGSNARTAIMRDGKTGLQRCVGYEAYGIPLLPCVRATWESAFAAVPVGNTDPAMLSQIILLNSHVQCLTDPTQTQSTANFGISNLTVPAPIPDCEARLFLALQD